MSWYTFLLWLHVTAAAVWVGGGLVLQLVGYRVLQAGDPAREGSFGRDAEWIGMRLFAPASLALIVTAVLLMIEADLPWGQLWILVSLGIWIASFVVGILYFGPESGRLGAIAAAEGPTSRAFVERRARMVALIRVELTALFLVVFLMTVKPSGDDAGALLVALAIVVVGGALSLRIYQGLSQRAVEEGA